MTARRRVGIDVGGTKCLGVAIDDDGRVVDEERRDTPDGPEAIVDELASIASRLGSNGLLGVGLPGLVTRDGVLRAAPNLVDINDFEVGRMLRERVGGAVEVDNDATCAAVGEWRLGAARGADEVIVVTLGTGIGGGVVSGGRLMRGANGFTGEIGHMVIDPDGPPCPCGRRGCWERFASGTGLSRLAQDAARRGELTGIVQQVGGDLGEIRGEHVRAAAEQGDDEAMAVVDEFARWVALGLVNLTNALDPALFVLGGGVAADGEIYLRPIERWFGELLYAPALRPHPDLRLAELGETAGAVGAALLFDVHAV